MLRYQCDICGKEFNHPNGGNLFTGNMRYPWGTYQILDKGALVFEVRLPDNVSICRSDLKLILKRVKIDFE